MSLTEVRPWSGRDGALRRLRAVVGAERISKGVRFSTFVAAPTRRWTAQRAVPTTHFRARRYGAMVAKRKNCCGEFRSNGTGTVKSAPVPALVAMPVHVTGE